MQEAWQGYGDFVDPAPRLDKPGRASYNRAAGGHGCAGPARKRSGRASDCYASEDSALCCGRRAGLGCGWPARRGVRRRRRAGELELRTRVTELLGIRFPIIQGGLAYLAYAELAAAVSNAGGLGQITATFVGEADWLRREIAKVRALTDRPFGVNFSLGRRFSMDLVEVALAEGVPVMSVTGGNPEPVLARLAGTPVKKMVLVAGVRQAQKAESLGADVIIAVGCEGGGHIGRDDVTTMVLVPRVARAVSVPVVASGGIADGRGLAAALMLGAEGVEMGTRFVATQECIAHPRYKEALLRAKETDTIVIERTIGRPARTLRTPYTEDFLAREARGATPEELLPLVSGEANVRAAIEGRLEEGFVWMGQGVGLIDDVPPVGELVPRIVAEAIEACQRAARRSGGEA